MGITFNLLFIAIIIAVDVGCVLALTRESKKKFGGYLVITEDSEEDSPYIFFEFKIKPDELMNNEKLVVEVRRKYIS